MARVNMFLYVFYYFYCIEGRIMNVMEGQSREDIYPNIDTNEGIRLEGHM